MLHICHEGSGLMHEPADTGLLRDIGCIRPVRGWSRDPHLLIALAAALPVWLMLGATAGHAMQAPRDAWAWLSLVAVQPLVEELVFRGILQGWLLRLLGPQRLGSLSVANLLTTVAFVAMHLPSQPAAWAASVAAPSLVFGHLRERLRSLWPAALVHGVYNAGFGVVAVWAGS